MRQLHAVLGNSVSLDGGAMFGNAPKAMWSKWIDADDENRIKMVTRGLVVAEPSGRHILFEAGIGSFFPPKYKDRYGVIESDHVLIRSLADIGLAPDDIDVIVLSHLHFDHAGGLLKTYSEGKAPELLFERASYVCGAEAFARSIDPHPRDRASFIPELAGLLEATGRVEKVSGDSSDTLGDGFRFFRSHGHTPGMLLSEIEVSDGSVIFAADLIPGVPWIHAPITMGYDRFAEQVIDEKSELLSRIADNPAALFFTHDADTAMATVTRDERGRFCAKKTWNAPQKLSALA